MTPEQRIAVVRALDPEMATFNAGSMNFALYPVLAKYKEFKHEWESEFLASTEGFISPNTFTSLKVFCQTMNEVQTQPELEIYDVGHITNLAQIMREGYLKSPIYLQFVLGILGGIPATVENLVGAVGYLASEVNRGADTSDDAMDVTFEFLRHVWKHPAWVNKDVSGFTGSRFQHALRREAISIVEKEIADPATVDECIRFGFGLRLPVLGALETADMVGTDLTLAIHDYILKHL